MLCIFACIVLLKEQTVPSKGSITVVYDHVLILILSPSNQRQTLGFLFAISNGTYQCLTTWSHMFFMIVVPIIKHFRKKLYHCCRDIVLCVGQQPFGRLMMGVANMVFSSLLCMDKIVSHDNIAMSSGLPLKTKRQLLLCCSSW